MNPLINEYVNMHVTKLPLFRWEWSFLKLTKTSSAVAPVNQPIGHSYGKLFHMSATYNHDMSPRNLIQKYFHASCDRKVVTALNLQNLYKWQTVFGLMQSAQRYCRFLTLFDGSFPVGLIIKIFSLYPVRWAVFFLILSHVTFGVINSSWAFYFWSFCLEWKEGTVFHL